jgi:rod shape-determining protein MreC
MVRRGEKLPEVIYRKHTPLASGETSPWVRRPARHLPLFLFLVFLSCTVIAIDLRYGFRWLTDLVGRISDPLVRSVDLVLAPVSQSATLLEETLGARRENQVLRERVAQLQSQISRYETANQENTRLRELLDLKAEIAPESMAAEVMRYRDEPAARLIYLRGGAAAGFRPNQPVLSKGGQLLGRITRSSHLISTVQLITDPACKISVTLEKTHSQGILYNRDGRLYVPLDRTELVQPNERVFTSHLSDLFPKGLLVGMIEGEADPREKDPLVAAELGLMKSYRVTPVLPPAEWNEIHEVLCLPVWSGGEMGHEGEGS